mgnify:CR=1 FL=1
MRVTQSGFYNTAVAKMNEQQNKVFKTQEQLSSGKQITKPSDDPAAATAANNLRSQMAENDRFRSNLDRVMSTMKMQETAVSSAVEQMTRIKTLSVQGANDAFSDSDRKSIAIEMKEIISGLVDLGNSRNTDGAYLFAGYDQQQAPFADAGGEVVYRGSHDFQQIMVDEGRLMEIGIPGSDVFGSVQHKDPETGQLSSLDFFKTLNSMVQALEKGDGKDVRALTDKISSVLEHAIVQQSSIGARMSRVESLQGTLEQRDFTFLQLQSQLEDLDYVEAATRLKNETLALQAGQQTFTQISGLSLFKYIN